MTRRSFPFFALFTVYFLVFCLLKFPIGPKLENFILDSSSGSHSLKISTIHQNPRGSKIRFFGQKLALFRPVFEASWRPGIWCQANGNCATKKLQHFSKNLPSFKQFRHSGPEWWAIKKTLIFGHFRPFLPWSPACNISKFWPKTEKFQIQFFYPSCIAHDLKLWF